VQSALKPLAAAVLLTCVSSVATADSGPFSQFIVFGDSLSDAGTFPDVQSSTIDGLRFTNRIGPTYGPGEAFAEVGTQRLAAMLGVQSESATPLLRPGTGGTNYAVGGYHTEQIFNSISGNSNPGTGNRPGYLASYTRADANALYYLNGGGNDIFQSRDMITAAGYLAGGVAALQAAGARYIIVSDLPDVGSTPLGTVNGATDDWNGQSTAFNTELASRLQAQGGNYVLVNNRLLLSEVQADLAAFGFDPNVTQTAVCFDPSSTTTPCMPDPTYSIGGTAPDPSRLMFNDGVHPPPRFTRSAPTTSIQSCPRPGKSRCCRRWAAPHCAPTCSSWIPSWPLCVATGNRSARGAPSFRAVTTDLSTTVTVVETDMV